MKKLKLSFSSLWFSFRRLEFAGTSVVHSYSLNFSFPTDLEQRRYYVTQQEQPNEVRIHDECQAFSA
jgi:hypothetical protein